MPPIRSIQIADDVIRFTDMDGVDMKLLASDIPKEFDSPKLVEDYLNKILLPQKMGNGKSSKVDPQDGKTYTVADAYQFKIHVLSLKPLQVKTIVADADVIIPANWWDIF